MAFASTFLASSAFVSIAIVALFLIRFYLPLRTTPQYLLFPVYLAVVIPSSIIALVPIDLASNAGADKDRGVVLGPRVLLVAWRICYWLSFALTWAILPILQSYSDSGHRSPNKRFIDALKDNAKYQLIVLALGAVGLVYYVSSVGFNYTSIKSLVIALSYFYALTLAVYLMGHGLVAIPRNLWRQSSIPGRLRRLQTKAPKLHDALMEANYNLEEVEKEVWAVSKKGRSTSAEFQEWIDELVDMLSLPEATLTNLNTTQAQTRARSPIPQVITEQYLAQLTRRLRNTSHKRARYQEAWELLVRQAYSAQTILDSSASKKLIFRPNPHSIAPVFQRWNVLTPYLRYLLHYSILPPLQRGIAVFLGLASACIIWSEILNVNNYLSDNLSIVGLSVVHHRYEDKRTVGFAGQLIAGLWIAYMCSAAYNSMTSVKVWGSYALVRRRTSGASACFYASYACRLTVPLTYNFTNFLPTITVKPTVFQNFFGVSVNLTHLGTWFQALFPILILLPVCATLFNLYTRIQNAFGFGADVLDDSDDDEEASRFNLSSGWREGRDLIERELGGAGVNNINNTDALPTTPLNRTRIRQQQEQQQPRNQQGSRSERERLPRNSTGRDDNEGEGTEEGTFEAFFHRVRNTFDVNVGSGDGKPPKWMSDIGDAFKKPKWMGGDGDDNGEGGSGGGRGGGRTDGGGGGGGGGAPFGTRPKWMTGSLFNDDDR